MPTTTLFTADVLTEWLHRPVSVESAAVVEGVVWGWLRPVLAVAERPDIPSPELLSWAIELGGIAFVNPENLSKYDLETESSEYSSERREEILRTAANGGAIPAGTALKPRGKFPPARCYPDPAERW